MVCSCFLHLPFLTKIGAIKIKKEEKKEKKGYSKQKLMKQREGQVGT
jgi:hypothetical protein